MGHDADGEVFNAYTQYVGPLVGDFFPGFSDEAEVVFRYDADGDGVRVQWSDVPLFNATDALFSFGVHLGRNGSIVFYFLDVDNLPEYLDRGSASFNLGADVCVAHPTS